MIQVDSEVSGQIIFVLYVDVLSWDLCTRSDHFLKTLKLETGSQFPFEISRF